MNQKKRKQEGWNYKGLRRVVFEKEIEEKKRKMMKN